MTSLFQRYQMIAMRKDVCVRHTIATITFYLPRFLIDIDFKVEAAPQLDFFFKLRCAHPSVDVIHPSVLDVKGMDHHPAPKNQMNRYPLQTLDWAQSDKASHRDH